MKVPNWIARDFWVLTNPSVLLFSFLFARLHQLQKAAVDSHTPDYPLQFMERMKAITLGYHFLKFFNSCIRVGHREEKGIKGVPKPLLKGGTKRELLCSTNCSKSSFFVQKFNFDFPRKLSIFLGEKTRWKCCNFRLFSCWQLWFHKKSCQKNFGWKTHENVGVLSKLKRKYYISPSKRYVSQNNSE